MTGTAVVALGGNAITLNGGITSNSAAAQTINLPIALGASTTVNVGFNGALTVGPGANGSGVISGSFGLTKTGDGTLTLGAANTCAVPLTAVKINELSSNNPDFIELINTGTGPVDLSGRLRKLR